MRLARDLFRGELQQQQLARASNLRIDTRLKALGSSSAKTGRPLRFGQAGQRGGLPRSWNELRQREADQVFRNAIDIGVR